MLLERTQTPASSAPSGPRPRPLTLMHPLVLAVFQASRAFPWHEPLELGAGVRGAALAAAEAVLAAGQCQGGRRNAALADAARRLRELGCCLEVARRLGYLPPARMAEIAALLAEAHQSVAHQEWAARTRRAGSLSQ